MKHNQQRERISKVLLHEYRRASIALHEFQFLSLPHSKRRAEAELTLAIFDAYGRFVHHLYEFYRACIATHPRYHGPFHGPRLDGFVQQEVKKLMGHRADRISRGEGASWDNHASFYREPVPPDFARDFRQVRNQLAHVSPMRLTHGSQCTLGDFYRRYHRFAILMFDEVYWLWNCDDLSRFDVEDFKHLSITARGPTFAE